MTAKPLTSEKLAELKKEFDQDPKNLLAQNICSRVDPYEVCISRRNYEGVQHVYTHKVETDGKPVSNQKISGRCWIFSALNVIRLPFMKQLNIEEFEFSQGYLFFWDKIERCHYWLNSIVNTARRGEEVDGRLVTFLLHDPTSDGGQWDMIVNLINKHGLMPKKCFPESFSCEESNHMNAILKSKLRQSAKELRELVAAGASDDEVQATIEEQMKVIYKVVAICLSTPPETFQWDYYNKSKTFNSIGPVTPLEFYEKHIKPIYNVDDKVCLVTDPRAAHPYGRLYTVDCLGNTVGGRRTLYNNQPVLRLRQAAARSVQAGEAVWFGCDVHKRFHLKMGVQDTHMHDFSLVFGTELQLTLDKADRVIYGESAMTHAMAFTAVSVDEDSNATKFRVENSWGEERGDKGFLLMTAKWFDEFVYEVVCDKKFLSEEIMEVFKQEPITLPAWDPMGTLAN